MSSIYACKKRSFARKKNAGKTLSDKSKKEIYNRMVNLATAWESGHYKSVKDLGYNNTATFEWLWEKFTHKPLDPGEFGINFRDVRKFEHGLKYYEKLVSSPRSWFARKFFLPRQAMQNVPELKKFERNLTKETSFFRDFNIQTGKMTEHIIKDFNKLAQSFGDRGLVANVGEFLKGGYGQRKLRKLTNERDTLLQQMKLAKNINDKRKIADRLLQNQKDFQAFYETGSGPAFLIINSVLKGADIETVTYKDSSGKDTLLNSNQKTHLRSIQKQYSNVRVFGVKALVRALDKQVQMARSKKLEWVEPHVEKLKGLIKTIEFQKQVDENGVVTKYENLKNERDFLKLGFSEGEKYTHKGKLAFTPHYMTHYTLGMLGMVKDLSKVIERGTLTIDQKLEQDFDQMNDLIVNVAKGKSKLSVPEYDADPYFFIKKYVNDVGVFNYKTHVKDNFMKASKSIIDEHLKPARAAKRDDLASTAEDMLKLINDVNNEIQHKDNINEGYMQDMMRLMTSLTYFRLMGGNLRSAARNATQRFYEFVEFGGKAVMEAKAFYQGHGSAENNQAMVNRQKQNFGLQWHNETGKISSNLLANLSGDDAKFAEQSRGALEQSYSMDGELFIDKDGNLTTKGSQRITERAAAKVTKVAGVAGIAHRIVEDRIRSGTFSTGFALVHENLSNTSIGFKARKMLSRSLQIEIKKKKGPGYVIGEQDLIDRFGVDDYRQRVDDWVENTSGQMAYNLTLDLHFEYAKWNKARAIRTTNFDEDGNEMSAGKAFGINLAKSSLGQFAHYRFNMANLLYKWASEAGISIKAGDLMSEQALKPIRYGLLKGMVEVATIGLGYDLANLFQQDTEETGSALFWWLASKREKLQDGEISEETLEKMGRKTYGQGGYYFLGPNIGWILSAWEVAKHAEIGATQDETLQFIFEDSALEAYKAELKTDERTDLFKKISLLNVAAARAWSYSLPVMMDSGVIPFLQLEMGGFLKKDQREKRKTWKNRLGFGTSVDKRRKYISKSMTDSERRDALRVLSKVSG